MVNSLSFLRQNKNMENKEMLDHLRACKRIDQERTRAREKRNVEGTNQV